MNLAKGDRYHHGNLRPAMIEIGTQLVAEGGVSALTLREVARRADVSPSAAYRHFAGQEELVLAVQQQIVGILEHRIVVEAGHLEPKTVAEWIRTAARGYFSFSLEETNLFECLIAGFELKEDKIAGDAFGIFLALVRQAFFTMAEQQRESGAHLGDAGGIFADPSDEEQIKKEAFDATIGLWSAVHGIAILCATGTLVDRSQAQKWEYFESTIAMAIRGLFPEGIADTPAKAAKTSGENGAKVTVGAVEELEPTTPPESAGVVED